MRVEHPVKKIGFLSFGHWSDAPGSQVRSASDSLLQSVELAVAAEEIGADGAYFRVHHFAQQLGSPFPLLAAVGARTNRIEIGTAVIDMRYRKSPCANMPPVVLDLRKLGGNDVPADSQAQR